MPSPDGLIPSDCSWIEQQKQKLESFANKIESCIDNSEWEMLSVTLESRQEFLEKLFLDSVPESWRYAMIQLAESILERDKFFQAKVEEQKNISSRLQLALERGRRAVQAYNNH